MQMRVTRIHCHINTFLWQLLDGYTPVSVQSVLCIQVEWVQGSYVR